MGASTPSREEVLASVRVLRQLGARTPATYLGEVSDGGASVVLETYANLDARVMRAISESARRLRGVRHPHLVMVVSVEAIGPAWSIVTEHVDGLPLADVFFGMSLGARLRVVVDVLTALSALHVPIAQSGAPLIHGGVLLRSAFVDKTGKTKLGFAYQSALCVGKNSYAPEALLADEKTVDARTDVYGAGVLLWEAVTGRPLFSADSPEVIVRKQLSGRVDKALPAARDRWARSLLPVIERALAIDPTLRYATIAEMAAALRIAVRARLMIHEDIIEELWPAETKPKAASGVQPIREEQHPEVLASETRIVVAGEPEPELEPLRDDVQPSSRQASTPPSRALGVWATVALAVTLLAIVAGVLAMLVHSRTRDVARGAPAESLIPTPSAASPEPVVPASTATVDEPPAIPQVAPTTPSKGVRRPAKPHGTYNPSSI